MSDYHRDHTYQTARKVHACGPCGCAIPIGETYVQQTGFWEGSAYRNRYHQECWDAFIAEGEGEFCPGSFEPPERLFSAPAPTPKEPTA